MTMHLTIATRLPAAPDWRRLRKGLFGSVTNGLITLVCISFLGWLLPPLVRWAVLNASWTGDAESCRAASGACWAFIVEKLRFILFGFYPADQQWRAMAVVLLLAGFVALACRPAFWRTWMVAAGIAVIAISVLLLHGFPGETTVPTDRWGGLPLTLLLTFVGMTASFPLAVLLALGRRANMGFVRVACVTVIETVRGVPLIALLYIATLLVPLMLPPGYAIDKLLRAQLAIILFVAAYMAEIIRAGLQAIPAGQYDAARSLGLGYWGCIRLVVLPQALKLVIPSLVTLGIGIFLDSTLIVVIGLFDVLNTARSSATDPQWIGFYDEAFFFAALLYLGFSITASRYSLWLEQRLHRGHGQGAVR